MSRLKLSLLGAFEAVLDEKPLPGIKTDKARALLIYLSVESGRAHRRQALAGLLWPDYPEEGARANLRHALSNLRQVLGEEQNKVPFLLVEGETLQLNPDSDCWLDVAEFERLAAGAAFADLESAIRLYRGRVLEGFSLKDSPDFDNWTAILRERYQGLASVALGRLADSYEQGKDYEKAIRSARRRLELEPWQEEAHCQLMKLLALNGQRAAALAQYEVCCKIIKEELGVEPAVETKRLQASIREGEISALKQEKVRYHNLPAQLTSFIGREKEIEQVINLIKTHRLVTLTGAGGTGKTRLSLQVGGGLLEQYPDGVWLVELAPMADSELVVQTAARTLGMRLEASPQALSLLEEYLEAKRLLLILDNCEHLIEACARLADALLKACPHLHILVTSREALGIEGEAPYRVPPLAFPQGDEPVENLREYEAVRLFVERAETASTGFRLTLENTHAVAGICQRLDGIPLALELAAARVKILSVEEISHHLDDRFRLLTGGSRAALPRYQTLRASIDWSYDLLSEAEKSLLQRLSVFAGSWVLEAAEFVGCGEDFPPCEVLDGLSQLVNKSLVIVDEETMPETRYRMLETIRQYAHEKLVELGRSEAGRDRHLTYYVELAERFEDTIRGPDQALIMSHLDNELGNIRLALDWSISSPTSIGDERISWLTDQGLRLGAALMWFWHCRENKEEGSHWLNSLLALQTDQELIPEKTLVRAKALFVAGYLEKHLGEILKASELLLESQILYKELGSQGKKGYACVLFILGGVASAQGNFNLAEQYTEESLSILLAEGDRFWVSEDLAALGDIASGKHDYQRARTYYEKSLAMFKEIGDQEGTAYTLYLLGALFLDYFFVDPALEEKARALFEESREVFYKINSFGSIYMPIYFLGTYYWRQGEYAKAEAYFEEALSTGQNHGLKTTIIWSLINLGNLALSRGDLQQAAKRFDESLAISLKGDSEFNIALSLDKAGLLAWEMGDYEQASQKYTQALAIRHRLGGSWHVEQTYLGSARVAWRQGKYELARAYLEQALGVIFSMLYLDATFVAIEAHAILAANMPEKLSLATLVRATQLVGATQAWHQKTKLTRTPREREEREDAISTIQQALGIDTFEKAWEEGKAMTLEQAIAYAKENW